MALVRGAGFRYGRGETRGWKRGSMGFLVDVDNDIGDFDSVEIIKIFY